LKSPFKYESIQGVWLPFKENAEISEGKQKIHRFGPKNDNILTKKKIP
jgi:hypothetical protein